MTPLHADFGMPTDAEGPHGRDFAMSMPSFGRRLLAVLIDWIICRLIAIGLLGGEVGSGFVGSFLPLGVFFVLNVVLVGLVGSTIGHRILHLRVGQARPGFFPRQVVVRTALLCLVLPAVLTNRDGRPYHDHIAGTFMARV